MKLLGLSFIVFTGILLTACVSDSSSENQTTSPMNAAEATVASEIVIPAASETAQSPVIEQVEPPITPVIEIVIPPWLRISMHYKVLMGQPHIWNEVGGTLLLSLAKPALAEATSIELNSTADLLPLQLISYLADNGEYYSAQIQSIENNTLLLTTPLEQAVSAGSNAWNFYDNGSHPNTMGYRVIADYAVRFLGRENLNEGMHVLLGDSWFGDGSIADRLKADLPMAEFVNKGIGGNTSTDILARFDEDVLPHNPSFVWIMAGTNDYWQDVSVATYKSNIDTLVTKIKAINAVPVVFDSSVGTLNFGQDTLTVLSDAYVTAIDELLAGN